MSKTSNFLATQVLDATERTWPNTTCVQQLIEAQVGKSPDAIAVENDKQTLTYAQLNREANQLALYLREHCAIGSNSIVGIGLARSPQALVAVLATLKSGAAYLPLDPDLPLHRLQEFATQAQLRVILTSKAAFSSISKLRLTALSEVVVLDDSGTATLLASQPSADLPLINSPADLAYVLFTSGSTGKPKGVMIEHCSLINQLYWAQSAFSITPDDVFLHRTSLSFDPSISETILPLTAGARVFIADPARSQFPSYLAEVLTSKPITTLDAAPSLLQAIIEVCRSCHPNHLKRVFVGAEPLTPRIQEQFFDSFPEVELHNLYGPTETTLQVTHAICRPGKPITLGKPVANTRIYVLDEHCAAVDVGVPGELHVAGIQLARGYLNRPDLTAQRFVEVNIGKVDRTERLYKTGDLVCFLEDGSLEYLGRNDQQIKLRGFRIELEEIESTLREHSTVKDVAVVPRKDSQGRASRLIAFVTSSKDHTVSPDVLRSFLKERLSDYMVPSAFVSLATLPLVSYGKIDRARLAQLAQEVTVDSSADYVAPRDALEQHVCEVWAEFLECESSSIGVHSHFMELGVDSLVAARIVNRLISQMHVNLPASALFSAPTVAELSQYIAKLKTQKSPNAPAVAKSLRSDLPTFAQEAIWFLSKIFTRNQSYLAHALLEIRGELNVDTLAASLTEIVARHTIFRATFHEEEGALSVQLHEPWVVNLETKTLAGDPQTTELSLKAIQDELSRSTFNIEQLPLTRWLLFRVGERHHLLLQLEHHLVHDGWSQRLLYQELATIYSAKVENRLHDLPPPMQFTEFACWQREWVESAEGSASRAYWKRTLNGIDSALTFPGAKIRPAVQQFRGDYVCGTLPVDLWQKLTNLSQREHVTPFVIAISAFYVLLYRYSGATDIVLGSSVANRPIPAAESVVGMLVNMMALRVKLHTDESFLTLLKQVESVLLGAYDNQSYPFSKVVDAVGSERTLTANPLFQLSFNFHHAPLGKHLQFGEAKGIFVDQLSYKTAKFDLEVILIPPGFGENASPLIHWIHNTDVYDSGTVQELSRRYLIILERLLETPECTISSLPILHQQEQHRLIISLNRTQADFPNLCIHQLFEEQARKSPQAVALICEGQALSYLELNTRANQLAHYLKEHYPIAADALVGICTPRSAEMLVAILATLKAGAAYMPLESTYPSVRLRGFVAQAPPCVILSTQSLLSVVQEFTQQAGSSSSIPTLALDDSKFIGTLDAYSSANPKCTVSPRDLAQVIFTSGSTGTPKGVMVEHRNIVRLVRSTNYVKVDNLTVLQFSTIAFDASTFEIWSPLLNGGKLVLFEGASGSLDALAQILIEQRINTMFLTAALFQQMVDTHLDAMSGLEQLLVGGDVVSPSHTRKMRERAPSCVVINGYGPTENTTFSCCHRVDYLPDARKPIPIGKPINNSTAYVLDRHYIPVPIGVPGELYVGGAGLTRGYFGRTDLTTERFVNLIIPGLDFPQRLYKTGDICTWREDGTLDFLHRIDHQVKLRGFRVELTEIEIALRQYSELLDAAVVAKRDNTGRVVQLIAFIVPVSAHSPPSSDALRNFLKERLPDYMVPAAFSAVADQLPITPNAKVDRKHLEELALSLETQSAGTYVSPRTPEELLIGQMWQEALGVDRVGCEDDFFELGGDSLVGMKFVSQLRVRQGVNISIGKLFEHPTVASFARVIVQAKALKR